MERAPVVVTICPTRDAWKLGRFTPYSDLGNHGAAMGAKFGMPWGASNGGRWIKSGKGAGG